MKTKYPLLLSSIMKNIVKIYNFYNSRSVYLRIPTTSKMELFGLIVNSFQTSMSQWTQS